MKNTLKIFACMALVAIMILAVCSCTVPADQVTVPAGTKNAVVVRYVKNANNTVTATISIEGDVAYAAVVGSLNYDSSVLTYVSHEAVDCANVTNKEAGAVTFAQANSQNYTAKQTLFKVTFSYTTAQDTKLTFTFDEGNFTNDQFADVEYSVIGGDLKLA